LKRRGRALGRSVGGGEWAPGRAPAPIPFIVSKFKTPSKGFKLQAGAYAVSA